MNSDNYESVLDDASQRWGIDAEFWDIWGRKHITPPETKQAVLRAMGVDTATAESIRNAIRERDRKQWTSLVPPCLVISATSGPRETPLYVPAPVLGDAAEIRIQREDGAMRTSRVAIAELAGGGSQEFDGVRYERRILPLPSDLPLGYHDIEVRLGGRQSSLRLIVTPDRAYAPPPRAAGLAVALYGLRSARNWGCGDFRDLVDLAPWVAEDLGAEFIALNPMHAIHNRRPFNTSPYLPNCVFYQNFIYLDVEAIEDFRNSRRAQRLWADRAVQAEIVALRESGQVEYERVCSLKLRFLKLAFATFLRESRDGGPRARAFRAFCEREGQLLERFAIYCALDAWLHARNRDVWIWRDWPAEYQDPDSEATAAFRRRHWRSVQFHQYLQWQIDLQLAEAQEQVVRRGVRIGLYHDLALATDRFGSDLWAHRDFFVSGCRVGSPPDDFAPKGQDWAFPPPHADHHWETGYRLFVESIRKNCRHGGVLRIDHVMRFFRLYWIPDGVDATGGAYVRDRWQDLIRILALESVRNRVAVVGEDLGTVEPFVREALAKFGILSYRLFYFERNERGEFRRFAEYPVQALVSSTTHDLPTLAGFWQNEDIEARWRAGVLGNEENYRKQLASRAVEKQKMLDLLFAAGLLPNSVPHSAAQIPELTGELHNAVIGFLAETPSQLLVVNQEDLTKELQQQNLPGTTWQYPNWSRKMRYAVEQLRTDKTACDFTAMFRYWVDRTHRRSPA
jgi:4-alpha-glucanotransferase